MQKYKNNMTLRPRNPLFNPQNGLKCNISSITAQKPRQSDVNHILIYFCVLLGHFETIYMQEYMYNMTLGPNNPLFNPQNGLKCNISSITAQKPRQSDVKHILIRFGVLMERFDTICMQNIRII